MNAKKLTFLLQIYSATDLRFIKSYLDDAHLFVIEHKNATQFTGLQGGYVHRWSHDQILVQSNVIFLATANMLHIAVVTIIIFLERTYHLCTGFSTLNVRHNLNSSHHWWTCKLHFMQSIYSTNRGMSYVM
jgi:hypothetical protein